MLTEQEVKERLIAAVAAAAGQRSFATKHGFSFAYINDVVRGRRDLSERILAAIGVERVITYRLKDEDKSQNRSQSADNKKSADPI